MNRIVAARMSVLLASILTISLTACSGGGTSSTSSSNSALDLAGTWTIKTVSTQGQGSFSATTPVSQSGSGLNENGTTTLAATVGQIALTQLGSVLSGTISNLNPKQAITYNFTGTLSSGNFTITGSAPCTTTTTQSTTLAGTVTSNAIQGTYTITRPARCYYPNDAGTFVATKQ